MPKGVMAPVKMTGTGCVGCCACMAAATTLPVSTKVSVPWVTTTGVPDSMCRRTWPAMLARSAAVITRESLFISSST